MKLIYAAMFALFPLAAPAQTLDPSTFAAVCNDDHCDDSCSQVDALDDSGGILSIEVILEKYSAVLPRDAANLAGDLPSDSDDLPVGSIGPQIGAGPAEHAILTLPDDDFGDDEPAGVRDTISFQVAAPQTQFVEVAGEADDVPTTGPASKSIPAVAAVASGEMRSTKEGVEGGVDVVSATEHSEAVNQRK